MPRKTLILIFALVLVTIVLFVVALKESNKEQMNKAGSQDQNSTQMNKAGSQDQTAEQLRAANAHTVLSLVPNPVTVAPGQKGEVDVNIDASTNKVTAVQLELTYDPTVLTNVKVTSGPLFPNPAVLINKNDTKTGRITYAFGITPNGKTVQGTGSVATISFTARNVSGKQSAITLLPETLVTAQGVASSVLKSATGTTVIVGNPPTSNSGIKGTAAPVVVNPNTTNKTDSSQPVVVGPAQ